MALFEGHYQGAGFRFALVASRFNEFITSKLMDGARSGLLKHGVSPEDIDECWTPGAFELPLAALRLAKTGRYDAAVCLGAVIRGSTPHFEYVASESAKGIARVSLETGVPAIYGVLTVDTIEQAIERAGTKSGNKGFEAAVSAIEMASLMKALRSDS